MMRWQLVPATEPAFATKLSTINARSETVFESRLYRDLVVRQRCILPLSGFFEWKNDGQRKRPFKNTKDVPGRRQVQKFHHRFGRKESCSARRHRFPISCNT